MKLVRLCILLLCVFVAPAAAQKTVFDPARDLDGFEARSSGPWADAYALEVFTGLAGAELNASLLEDVRKRWLEERTKVDLVVKGEPFAAAAWMTEKRMARHAALKRLSYAQERGTPPFVVYVQREAGAPETAVKGTLDLYMPWLAGAQAALKQAVLLPGGAKEAQGRGATGVVLLATREQYESLRPELGNDGASNTATWDRARRLVVGCDDEYNKKSNAARVRGVVRETVRALLEAHATGPDGVVGDLWLEQGLVLRYAQCREDDPALLAKPKLRIDLLTRLAQEAQVRERREALFLPLERLCGLADLAALERASLETAEARGVAPATWDDAVVLAYAQSEAWMHFLFEAQDGKRAPGIVRYAAGALRGERGAQALVKALGGERCEELQAAFAAWLGAQWKALDPSQKDQPDPFAGLYAPLRAAAEAKPSASAAPQAAVEVDAAEAMLRHAGAFALAARGAFEGAQVRYAELLRAAPPEPWRGRAERDLKRVEDALVWRGAYAPALAEPGAKLVVERGGKKVSLALAAVDGATLRFVANKQGIDSLALEEIAPGEWLKQTYKKGAPGELPGYLRAWFSALAQEPKWDRDLGKDLSDETLALKEDVFVWYPEMLASAQAALELERLDALPSPEDRASAETVLKAIEEVLKARKLAFVAAREAELLARARLCLGVAANELGPADATRADVSAGADGRVKVHWGFDKPEQLHDIELEQQIGQEQLEARRKLVRLRRDPLASIENSALTLRGPGVWSLPISLEAPYTIKLKLKIKDDLQKEIKETPYFGILHSVAGKQAWILTDPFGGTTELDEASGMSRDAGIAPNKRLLVDETTTIEISHEGVNLNCGANGKWTSTLPLMRRRFGRVYLVAIGDYALRVEDIEIEGRIDRSWYQAMRAEWIERQYERLKGGAK